MAEKPNPQTLRTHAALFEKMLPSDATSAAAAALRFQADEIERRQGAIREMLSPNEEPLRSRET
jgi:hypothetical protein